MKSRNITTIIAEGTDGVGKSELIGQLFKIYNYRYMVYHRGELSNLFYAMKYGRPFSVTQNGLPFLHVLLVCDKEQLKERIMRRGIEEHQSYDEVQKELCKIDDQDEFIRLFEAMKNDYHMIKVDTTDLTIEEVGEEVARRIDEYVAQLDNDEEISEWNKMYEGACQKLGLKFSTKDNQPYINNVPFMSELTNQQGVYERFDNREYPDNLIYSMNYDIGDYEVMSIEKKYDFAYIINSKITRRPEIYSYYQAFINANKSCMISESKYIQTVDENIQIRCPRQFGNEFIRTVAQARATVYCARDLAHLKMQTARLYEAIIARQVVFVDKESDIDGDILKCIWGTNTEMRELLTVTPETIIEKYEKIFADQVFVNRIIEHQRSWYSAMLDNVKGGKF